MSRKIKLALIKRVAFLVLWASSGLVFGQTLLVRPYLQPGNASDFSREQKVLIWQSDSIMSGVHVDYALSTKPTKRSSAKVTFVRLDVGTSPSYLYRAVLTRLKFDQRYHYTLNYNGASIASGDFDTRTKKTNLRFALFADCGTASPDQARLAYHVYKEKPQFVIVAGDIAYSYGRELEYRLRFFPFYNAEQVTPDKGVPLMNTIPFYMLPGNHDMLSSDLNKHSDGLGYFYYTDPPKNAPVSSTTIRATGTSDLLSKFEKATEGRYPQITNYSFDYGNVHFLVLDANAYVNPLEPAMLEWLTNDLQNSTAQWKIVIYHHPPFNSSKSHYDDQWMRLLCPTLEHLGVDLVFSGHVHNYQRTVPIRFKPQKDTAGTHYIVSETGQVNGTFTLDKQFNGIGNRKPAGIIYIISGAGGAGLYDPELSNSPDLWKHEPEENWVPFTQKLISDVHSFTMVDTEGKELHLRQIDVNGKVIDEIRISK